MGCCTWCVAPTHVQSSSRIPSDGQTLKVGLHTETRVKSSCSVCLELSHLGGYQAQAPCHPALVTQVRANCQPEHTQTL